MTAIDEILVLGDKNIYIDTSHRWFQYPFDVWTAQYLGFLPSRQFTGTMTKQGYDNDIQLEEMPSGKNAENFKSDSTSESTNSSKNVGQPVKKTS